MSTGKISDIDIKRLQGDVLTLRQHGPKLVNETMNAFKEAIETDLKLTKYNVNNKQTVDFKDCKKTYLMDALIESNAKQPTNLMAKQIELNAKTDNLLKALEYLKK